jgi:alpha-galactosidase
MQFFDFFFEPLGDALRHHRINGPDVYGASPGKEFQYLIPTIGKRPLCFSAEGLPAGLALDASLGRISGLALNAGTFQLF